MAGQPAHGKKTVIKVGTKDCSVWIKTSTIERNPDIHDYTGYGVDDKLKVGGLRDNTFSMSGWYDITAVSGPGDVLDGHTGETVTIVRNVQGVGTGLPSQTFQAVLGKYTETSPCDDIVTWAQDCAISGPVTKSTQA